MICKLCLKEKKLIGAHIIPQCFFRETNLTKEVFSEFSTLPNQYPKRLPIGWYDKNILCKDCDNKVLGSYDRYACEILLQGINNFEFIIDSNNNIGAYKIKNIDYKKLKLFFLAILWRAAISTRQPFLKLALGQDFQEELRNRIKNFDPGDHDTFSVFVWRFKERLGQGFVLNPAKEIEGFNGIMLYRFYLGAGYGFSIKVDRLNLPASNIFYPLFMKQDGELFVLLRNFLRSKELHVVIKNMIEENKKRSS